MIPARSWPEEAVPDRVKVLYPTKVRSILDVGCGFAGPVNYGYWERRDTHDRMFWRRDRSGRLAYKAIVDMEFAPELETTWAHVKADGAHLPFADRTFDVVSSTETLEHIPTEHQGTYLEELSRVASKLVFVTTTNQSAHSGPGQDEAETRNKFQHYYSMPDPEFLQARGYVITWWDGAHIEAHKRKD